MYTPSCTYRIQFNSQFTFKKLEKVLPYLKDLGIGCIYASPVFESTPGSNHGYDVTDPFSINTEIGIEEDLVRLTRALRNDKIGWIQDIVPNHMAFHTKNQWLMDVLAMGRSSAFSGFFDIDWDHPQFLNKVMVPILGNTLKACVEAREIQLSEERGNMSLSYYDFVVPVSKESVAFLKKKFSQADNPGLCDTVNNNMQVMLEFLELQHYVLTYWQDTSVQINYRRFFSINGLISLRMEEDKVFETYHEMIFNLAEKGIFSGLRIDHIDGLKYPAAYFEKLRSRVGSEKYVVVEKILKNNEKIDTTWPVEGSTGYDFLAMVNNVFTNPSAMPLLKGFYREITSSGSGEALDSPDEFIFKKKKQILYDSFRGDLDNICRLIEGSGLVSYSETVTSETIREAVGLFLALCPVYKIYSGQVPLYPEDAEDVQDILAKVSSKKPSLKNSINALAKIFLDKNPVKPRESSAIFNKIMQYTGPLMAKGIEDTAMYAWTSFISHNEVGDAIDASGLRISEFHKIMEARRKKYPASMNATSTHDTKRGEDVRARLNVISDIPDEWVRFIRESVSWNEYRKKRLNGKTVPDPSEEYFIYQTLLGTFPMDRKAGKEYKERLKVYFEKVLREAKVHSDWNKPDTEYENAINEFVTEVLADGNFMKHLFMPFFYRLRHFGVINSLSQVALKCTCPGIPDFYQGTELWDLSLVDPDNRRPVNYDQLQMMQAEINSRKPEDQNLQSYVSNGITDGSIKLRFTNLLMKERRESPDFWLDAEYIPLHVNGDHKDYVLAFARRKGSSWYVVILPLHLAEICQNDMTLKFTWKNTRVELPSHAPLKWTVLWDKSEMEFSEEIQLDLVFGLNIPVILKGSVPETGRGSGILLHLTSLPGKFGIGNLGNAAFDFIDFLRKSGQKYWQILPFNPAGDSGSPYSSKSAFAGNTMLIDPEKLYNKRYITKLPATAGEESCDFRKARQLTDRVIRDAYGNFIARGRLTERRYFDEFTNENQFWLDDYIVYSLLKKKFPGASWNKWPAAYRNRDKKAMQQIMKDNHEESEWLKFAQYLFHKQFSELKEYARSTGIGLIGDVPVYVAFDSADVWSNPELFDLDSRGNMLHVAGVPPDFFSKTGQLWNMPVYNWDKMKKDHYRWWKKRIEKNLEYCSLLRLDHFRGFSAYWSVPAGEKTAKRGEWVKGPGEDLFDELKKAFPHMPFIAEDLGDIDDKVYALRDRFGLPGMKVLQFAFDEQMPWTVHIPHNHEKNSIVYTGTHDNNTIKGWYTETADRATRYRISDYTGRRVTEYSVAWDMIKMAASSVARIAVYPMQDILELGSSARLNTPSKAKGNWRWKLKPDFNDQNLVERLLTLTSIYGRT